MKARDALLTEERGNSGTHRDSLYSHVYSGGKHNLYSENHFLYTLLSERKRSERCGRPFCLILVNLDKVLNTPVGFGAGIEISGLLHSLTRETDVKGWYKFKSVIGVILTDTDRSGAQHVASKIRRETEKALDKEIAEKVTISIHLFPEENEKGSGHGKHREADLALYPDLSRQNAVKAPIITKRMIDIIGSLAGLVLLSPLFLIISLLVKTTSKGPVLFKQQRLGQFGKKFTFLKFRSMYSNMDPGIHKNFVKDFIEGRGCSQNKVYKITDDPRVTPFGRILRKTSLDEIPQFYNVLKGDMSLVGPRPPIPYEYENYDFWHKRRVIEVKPGITGLWQVGGRSRTTFDEMVRLDIKYIRERSLLLDIKIIAQTPLAVFFGDGAY